MKQWRSLILIIIFALIAGAAIRYTWTKSAQRKREANYQSALRSYSADLKPGMKRKYVEDYLREKGIQFQQTWGAGLDERSALSDLIRIGREGAPWYCSELDVYLALEFTAVEPHGAWRGYDSDTLQKVIRIDRLEGCL